MTLILIGRNDADALITGWHPVQEGPAGVPCRWMSQAATMRFPAPAPGGRLCVAISAPSRIRGMKPGLSVYAGDALVGHCADLGDEGAWHTAILDINGDAGDHGDEKSREWKLAIENRDGGIATPLAFVPHEIMGNGDLRELGALVSAVRSYPASKS